MAMKKKLSKEAYEKLSDSLKVEYSEKDGEYILDIEGEEDTGALKRAKDREVQARKDAEKKLKDLEDAIEAEKTGDSKRKGDVDALEKSWAKKYADLEGVSKAKQTKLENSLSKNLADSTASNIAGKISTVPKLLAKSLRERLAVDFEGDEPSLRVLDASGKPSALTVDELTAEFVANPDYSSIMIASKASGGATGKQTAVGGAPQKVESLAKASPADLAAHVKAKIEARTN